MRNASHENLVPNHPCLYLALCFSQVISNYTKKLASTDPEANPIRGPAQPPSWELPEGSEYPDVSDDESEGNEANLWDKPVSLAETRNEMGGKMEKKVPQCFSYQSGDTERARKSRPRRGTSGT